VVGSFTLDMDARSTFFAMFDGPYGAKTETESRITMPTHKIFLRCNGRKFAPYFPRMIACALFREEIK
jgi:hypothetical protein